jgi:hypothetical protein
VRGHLCLAVLVNFGCIAHAVVSSYIPHCTACSCM